MKQIVRDKGLDRLPIRVNLRTSVRNHFGVEMIVCVYIG